MKKTIAILLCVVFLVSVFGCATANRRQQGAGWGAAVGGTIGALAWQSNSWLGLLIGATAGAVAGMLVGDAIDQQEQAAIQAAKEDRRVVYYDKNDRAVEAMPISSNQHTHCKKVRTRIWENGEVVSDKIQEVCEATKDTPTYLE